ncbi:putative Mg2+ transporter-C (MgtC) family protein [Clostridium collagenovorans DSM 3089]|uniref:Putative Mg2+ transporter-C (MgtC) family protein n=1 Tax=Clostridium collagenovorans DSM 3089 TaxID=1121306 RepID=A0A1M5SYE2_9CLOT|nr:MgtC/SapB family protein [Clostridium collagenovorans]SHH43537.1 putative Mg2+ transporter-C (MgtC) family protein [Clostridium collagenovorans DSM 3089]
MDMYEICIRLCLAVAISAIIGFDREQKNRPAGLRTHILVCLGATIISILEVYLIYDAKNLIINYPDIYNSIKIDMSRIGAQVITGVGFLGAGSIIQEKGNVKGLTTAASLWVVACLGLVIGKGYYIFSIICSLIVFVVLASMKNFENGHFEKIYTMDIEIASNDIKSLKVLNELIEEDEVRVKSISVKYNDKLKGYIYKYSIESGKNTTINKILEKVYK